MNTILLQEKKNAKESTGGRPLSSLRAVVFDWAGTVVDCGCRGPVQAFVHSFAAYGMAITEQEAREPMGMGKRDHVAALLAMPRIQALWQDKHHKAPTAANIDAIYAHVENNMVRIILSYSELIPGTLQAVQAMRDAGLRIGSCTGYPRSVAEIMAERAKASGFAPDCLICATDVPNARPAPDMCLAALRLFALSDPWRAVKIGDTEQDMQEGKRAGMWTIGIGLTSSIIGASTEEIAAFSQTDREAAMQKAKPKLTAAGANVVVQDISDCLSVLYTMDTWCAQGKRPDGNGR